MLLDPTCAAHSATRQADKLQEEVTLSKSPAGKQASRPRAGLHSRGAAGVDSCATASSAHRSLYSHSAGAAARPNERRAGGVARGDSQTAMGPRFSALTSSPSWRGWNSMHVTRRECSFSTAASTCRGGRIESRYVRMTHAHSPDQSLLLQEISSWSRPGQKLLAAQAHLPSPLGWLRQGAQPAGQQGKSC